MKKNLFFGLPLLGICITACSDSNEPIVMGDGPDDPVPRQEMAMVLLKAIEGDGFLPPEAVGLFDDVPAENQYARWIEEIDRRGITRDCGTELFCPNASVNRAQMCVLILKTREGNEYLPPEAEGLFTDVPAEDPEAAWIEEITNRVGITKAGCGTNPPVFCPGDPTTRAQMDALIAGVFGPTPE